ncbi:uncharacterized protein FA14DRAFT_169572 [Meira miltonrushii]|uniref:Bromo domain-containing protein n=1 Tax=Meira miltonrushii TaxID=1280837 RepID=A0A316VG32_9BASI|nr:uncharacterized protein FA14DRAFT_169572 [Meira miltonrushii]PWN36587.1 hypothetical protein FA14DRAFT_169572 [Meira miltonrushii]
MDADGDGIRPRRRAAAPQFDQSIASPSRSNRPIRGSRASNARRNSRRMNDEDEDEEGQDDEEQEEADTYANEEDDDDDFERSYRSTSKSKQVKSSSRQRTTSNMAESTPPPSRTNRKAVKAEEDDHDEEMADVEPVSNQKSSSNAQIRSLKGTMKTDDESATRTERQADRPDSGWIEEIEDSRQARTIYMTIIDKIRAWLAERGDRRLTEFMETEPKNKDRRYLDYVHIPTSLQQIETRVQTPGGGFASSIDFEKAMMLLFKNGRRYFEPATETYGNLLILQRMYQHLTQSVDSVTEGIEDEIISRNYTSNKYGPGQEGENRDAGESPTVGYQTNVARHHYKGMKIAVGNWVHLMNPTDPSRPIIAQVFKTRNEDLGDHDQGWVTANWFLRPEQSKHPRSMTFWSNEVIKTGQYVEHHVEDILEVICVIFYTKANRGVPAEGEGGWHTGDPLYVCEMRYQPDRDAYFKIKNWASCMPEEVRHKTFGLIEFDRPNPLPDKLPSPFLRGIDGPGGIVSDVRPSISMVNTSSSRNIGATLASLSGPRMARRPARRMDLSEGELEIPQLFKEWRDEVQTQRRNFLKAKQQEKAAALEREKNTNGTLAPTSAATVEGETPQPEAIGLSGMGAAKNSASPFARTAALPNATASPAVAATSANSKVPVIAPSIDRSLNMAMQQMDASAYFKTLPEQTQQLFHQDPETGNVVWYPAPPAFGSMSEANLQKKWNQGQRFQVGSLDYLYHLANERAGTGAQADHHRERRRKADEASKKRKEQPQTAHSDQRSHRHGKKERSALDDLPTTKETIDHAFSQAIDQASHNLSKYIAVEED